jgi:diguanylate cyclase (GGDEF)-like protein
LFIDLDRFKVINDSLGHEAGDMLLVEIANRLRHTLRSSDVVARLGGDEFVVILEEAAETHDVERITRDLLSVLSEPLQLSGHECHTTASIGIAMYPSDGADVQTLTKNADMAMYAALSAEGGHGDRTNNRRRGAVALDPSRSRRVAARTVHTACRGNRLDRPDRPLGLEGSLRAKHGLAAPRIAAGIDGGQSLAEAVP